MDRESVLEKRANRDAVGSMPRRTRLQTTLLKSEALDQVCARQHLTPSSDLAACLAVAWTMEWKLTDQQTFTQQVLPNPSVQIVISYGQAEVFGIVTGAFATTLRGEGFVFALKFRPCGFFPVAKEPVSVFTNRRFPLRRVLPDIDSGRLQRMVDSRDRAGLLQLLEDELRGLGPHQDETGARIESLICRMEADSNMLTVGQAADWFGASSRTLQRLFHVHVGVSPKWMLRRFRLKEAAATIDSGTPQSMADLAQQLGYYDQAHLIRDFRAMVGQPPNAYRRSLPHSL